VLKRQRSDWFSIVATDLFCGALAAVIIFDAVSPKEPYAGRTATFISVEYTRPPKRTCHGATEVELGMTVDGNRVTSLDGMPSIVTDGVGKCMVQLLLQSAAVHGSIKDITVALSKYPGAPIQLSVQPLGQGQIQFACSSTTSKCSRK
jgi:hypothetical protein